jgi:bacterial/archaeal transporter family-2 protein
MRVQFYLVLILLGIILDVHLAMNGKVGNAINNPRVGNALFWCVGAVAALLIGFTGWRRGVVDSFRQVSPVLLTAGALGACLVFAIAWMLPHVGARAVFITLIAGQFLGGMVLSRYGWLDSPVQKIAPISIIGAVIMLGGVFPSTYSKAT